MKTSASQSWKVKLKHKLISDVHMSAEGISSNMQIHTAF